MQQCRLFISQYFACFRSFDKQSTGKISEKVFKQIMVGKDDVNESEIEEMLEEYYRY